MLNCRLPNPADDNIFCTKATHSNSSSTLERGVIFVKPSKGEGEFISSHDNEQATDSIAVDRKATLSVVQALLLVDSGSLMLLSSNDVSRTEVGLGSSRKPFRPPPDLNPSRSPVGQSEEIGTSMETISFEEQTV
uniref:Uncharacterized protein n=1 Tax=Arundo donax TaxID=35708 RepID=A0A0A9DBG8_ARUDO